MQDKLEHCSTFNPGLMLINSEFKQLKKTVNIAILIPGGQGREREGGGGEEERICGTQIRFEKKCLTTCIYQQAIS